MRRVNSYSAHMSSVPVSNTLPTANEVLDAINDSEFLLSPNEFYARMRRDAPLIYIPETQSWMVFRYDDVQRILTDFNTFSSKVKFPAEQKDFTQSMNFIDPPRHKSVRALAQQSFSLKRVEAMGPRIEALAHELLDRALEQPNFDFILEYANPLPVIVIAEIMGVPTEGHAQFTDLSNRVVTMDQSAIAEMAAYFRGLIEHRKVQPGDDLVTSLVQAYESEGDQLSEQELVDFCIVLLVAGNETTAKLIGNAMLCLRDFPEIRAELIAHPEKIGDFIEEVLRLRAPVQNIIRIVKVQTELYGQTMRVGETVEIFMGSANLDEAQFEDPLQFKFGRKSRHLAFGNGIHFCLGAPLARLEATIAIGHMLERVPNLRIRDDADLMPVPSYNFHGLVSLPVTH
jgi:cytochrome P450